MYVTAAQPAQTVRWTKAAPRSRIGAGSRRRCSPSASSACSPTSPRSRSRQCCRSTSQPCWAWVRWRTASSTASIRACPRPSASSAAGGPIRRKRPKWVAFVGYFASALSRVGLLLATGFASITAVIAVDRLGKGLRTGPQRLADRDGVRSGRSGSQLRRASSDGHRRSTRGPAVGVRRARCDSARPRRLPRGLRLQLGIRGSRRGGAGACRAGPEDGWWKTAACDHSTDERRDAGSRSGCPTFRSPRCAGCWWWPACLAWSPLATASSI